MTQEKTEEEERRKKAEERPPGEGGKDLGLEQTRPVSLGRRAMWTRGFCAFPWFSRRQLPRLLENRETPERS